VLVPPTGSVVRGSGEAGVVMGRVYAEG
jgi:hypothetical protein